MGQIGRLGNTTTHNATHYKAPMYIYICILRHAHCTLRKKSNLSFGLLLDFVPNHESFCLSHLMLSKCAEGSLKAAFASSNALFATSGVHSCSHVYAEMCTKQHIARKAQQWQHPVCNVLLRQIGAWGTALFWWLSSVLSSVYTPVLSLVSVYTPTIWTRDALAAGGEHCSVGRKHIFHWLSQRGASARQETLVH